MTAPVFLLGNLRFLWYCIDDGYVLPEKSTDRSVFMSVLTQSRGLSGNQLKLLALVTMTIDHIGLVLLPQYPIARIIGRLAMPIYAFMIAEGCRYTKSRAKYLLSMFALAVVCQGVAYVTTKTLYQCILVTFSLSIGLIWLIDRAITQKTAVSILAASAALVVVFFLCEILPLLLPGTDYQIDYGMIGVLLPLFPFLGKNKWQKVGLLAAGLVMMCLRSGGIQWYCLLALLPLALYGGHRGKASFKYLFYIYYPLHIALLQGIAMLR